MKKTILMFSMLFIAAIVAFTPATTSAQNNSEKVYNSCQVMPKFPGGDKAMMEFIASKLKYPQQAVKDNVQGMVLVEFIINTEGKATNPKIIRSLSPECDAEVIRVVGLMPAWTPGKQDGKVVNVKYTLPVMFKAK